MATLKEIAAAAHKADKAGNTEDAKKLTNLYFRQLEKEKKKPRTTYQKFKNAETGEIKLDSLLKSYKDLEKKFSRLDKSYVSEFENRVTTNMAAARQALKTSIEAGDVDGQVAAQENIARLNADAVRLSSLKALEEEEPKKVNIAPQQVRQPDPYGNVPTDAKAEDWASRNAWFGNDTAMTYTSFDIHKTLVEKEGYDPKSDEYYEEVDKRIRLEFPHKFDKIDGKTTERAKPAQNVASATRSSRTSRRKTVKLTPSQVAIAKKLGVPLEDYAKQLNITEGV